MTIRKKTQLFANLGAICFDPNSYPEPKEFKPERFLGADPQPNPRTFVFGFGQRICPGSALAEQTVFIIIASVLATFNINAKDGETYAINRKDGMIAENEPFLIDIKARSQMAKDLVLKIEGTMIG